MIASVISDLNFSNSRFKLQISTPPRVWNVCTANSWFTNDATVLCNTTAVRPSHNRWVQVPRYPKVDSPTESQNWMDRYVLVSSPQVRSFMPSWLIHIWITANFDWHTLVLLNYVCLSFFRKIGKESDLTHPQNAIFWWSRLVARSFVPLGSQSIFLFFCEEEGI